VLIESLRTASRSTNVESDGLGALGEEYVWLIPPPPAIAPSKLLGVFCRDSKISSSSSRRDFVAGGWGTGDMLFGFSSCRGWAHTSYSTANSDKKSGRRGTESAKSGPKSGEPTGAGRDSKVDSLAATKIYYDQRERSFSMNEIPSMA
jgi:hypothetical protein